jgi:2-keto-4-pentenoate hydratase/2-oxohepta-3-ene-1,7-dioic acid hydratase in catechol pathway
MSTLSFQNGGPQIRVGKILCLGRNYAEHAKEMKAEVPKAPVVFLKPSTAIIHDGDTVVIPDLSRDMHHEVELVVVIGKGGKNIPAASAMDHVAGYAVGLDMTLRDVQSEAKKSGLPWTVAKGFDTSAPVSEIVNTAAIPDPHALSLTLSVNGSIRQQGHTGAMLFRINDIIAYLSRLFTLEPGDLIFTGTPEGVGPVTHGDTLEASLGTLARLRVRIS